jgi:hypothetical protein
MKIVEINKNNYNIIKNKNNQNYVEIQCKVYIHVFMKINIECQCLICGVCDKILLDTVYNFDRANNENS